MVQAIREAFRIDSQGFRETFNSVPTAILILPIIREKVGANNYLPLHLMGIFVLS